VVEVLWALEEQCAQELVGLGEVWLVVGGGSVEFYYADEIWQHL
jgi:hypothetical protein